MTGPDDLTKVAVYLSPKAWAAVESAAERTGDSRTDTINRAVQLYDVVTGVKPGYVIDLAAGAFIVPPARPSSLWRGFALLTVGVVAVSALLWWVIA